MFIVGQTTKTLYEYVLPVAWDVSSIVASAVSLSLSAVTNDVIQCVFSRDGDFVFITDDTSVFSFPLPNAWDITSNVSNTSFSPGGIVDVDSLAFKTEGDKMYIGTLSTDRINEYDLSAPFDISSPTSVAFIDITINSISPLDIFWKPAGEELFILNDSGSIIQKFHLENAWEIFTASYFENTRNISGARCETWQPNGGRFFQTNIFSDSVPQLTIPGGKFNWNATNAVQNSGETTTPETNPQGIYFRKTGLNYYVVGTSEEKVFQYDCVNPFETLAANVTKNVDEFDLAGIAPSGIFFRDDGEKMYIGETAGSSTQIREYDLTDPFDLLTVQPVTDVFALGFTPGDVLFHPSGKLMYIADSSNTFVRLYSLEIPWSLSVSSNVTEIGSLDVTNVGNNVTGITIREFDGKRLWALTASGPNATNMLSMSLEFNNNIITKLGVNLITNLGENLAYA